MSPLFTASEKVYLTLCGLIVLACGWFLASQYFARPERHPAKSIYVDVYRP